MEQAVAVGIQNIVQFRSDAARTSLIQKDCFHYSGGVDELDKSLAAFPCFDFEAALAYLKLLGQPWLYARLGFFLDRHADKLFFRGKIRDQFLRKLSRGVVYRPSKTPRPENFTFGGN